MENETGGYVRQRRNLMIISLVLLFSEVAELKVSKLTAFGNELLIGKPYAVSAVLWIAGLYWLLRFYQYSRPTFRNSIRSALLPYVQAQGPRLALKKLLMRNEELRRPFPEVLGTLSYDIVDLRNHGITMHYEMRLQFTVIKKAKNKTQSIEQEYGAFEVQLTAADMTWTRVRAWLYLIVHTTQFTELILPYLLFALPTIYVAYRATRALTF